MTWEEKVKIADEVLRKYRSIFRPSKKEAIKLFNIRKDLKEIPTCKECGEPMWETGSGFNMGAHWANYQCKNGHKDSDCIDYTPKCENCGDPLPIIDADERGPQYGQCRKPECFGPIADVWNPKPNVFHN